MRVMGRFPTFCKVATHQKYIAQEMRIILNQNLLQRGNITQNTSSPKNLYTVFMIPKKNRDTSLSASFSALAS